MEHSNVQSFRVLVVEDEPLDISVYEKSLLPYPQSLNLLDKIFEDSDTMVLKFTPTFETDFYIQGVEAVEAVKRAIEYKRPFAVAFIDMQLPPGPNGLWTAKEIRKFDPNIEIVIATNYRDIHSDDPENIFLSCYKLLYLRKPLYSQEIYHVASALAMKWRTERQYRAMQEKLESLVLNQTEELLKINRQLKKEIDERAIAQKALKESEKKYRTLLEAIPDPVAVYDLEGRIVYINPAFTQVFGWSLVESVSRHAHFVPYENMEENAFMINKIARGETIAGLETRRLSKDGRKVDVSISGAGFFDDNKILLGSVFTFQNLTERKKIEEEFNFIAYHDGLTGLPNRKSFYIRMEEVISQSRRKIFLNHWADHDRWALLFLDLNNFKSINDTLGHELGDQLLKNVSVRLKECLRRSDQIFRLGGDEFTVMIYDLCKAENVAKVAQKICETIGQPYLIDGQELYITVSIGISIFPDDGEEVEALVKNADLAMYAAKERGEGYHFYTEEMNRKALERLKIESGLRTALKRNELFVHYQPIVDVDAHIIGTEALLRWNHNEWGIIHPGMFIPVAEDTGEIIAIGKCVLHAACQKTKQWQSLGNPALYVAVNVSSRQFKDPDFVETVQEIVRSTGLAPNCLMLELTESHIMESPEEAIEKMNVLRQLGIRFSIDDFGTGYSSLTYLKHFPIDILKIDRSFIADCIERHDDKEMIRTIILLARNLNLDTIAEGVETDAQRAFLLKEGCQKMQGYFFAKPMADDELEKLVLAKKPLI
jgi:diguanylate cyclase (GGDEF)-like protein/PAS domain S-box-containing protein